MFSRQNTGEKARWLGANARALRSVGAKFDEDLKVSHVSSRVRNAVPRELEASVAVPGYVSLHFREEPGAVYGAKVVSQKKHVESG